MDNNNQISLETISRIKGSLIGYSVGDMIGLPLEFMSAEEIKREHGTVRDPMSGGWLDLPLGSVSDDSEMTLCVARSLVECQGFNLKDIADKFVVWYDDPVDIGSTCRAGIHRYIKTGNLEAPYDIQGAGNGGAMRELPLILLYSHDREFMLNAVVSQSRLTHNNRESDLGCRCYADMVSLALTGASKEQLRQMVTGYPLFSPDKFDGKSGGYIVETLRTVLHYFFATDSFEDCIVGVVNNGQDADTCGALAGGLAGAFWGLDTAPARLLDALNRDVHNELGQLADQLVTLKEAL